MRDKEQPIWLAAVLTAEPFIVKGRNDGFTGPGSRHHQIAPVAANLALSLQFIENFLLISVGGDVKIKIGSGATIKTLGHNGALQNLFITFIERNKIPVVPIGFKGRFYLLNNIRMVFIGELDIPLQPGRDRGIGEVG